MRPYPNNISEQNEIIVRWWITIYCVNEKRQPDRIFHAQERDSPDDQESRIGRVAIAMKFLIEFSASDSL
jgi:hypothetical protein